MVEEEGRRHNYFVMPSYNTLHNVRNNQANRRRIMNVGGSYGNRNAGGRITKMFVGNLSFDTTWQGMCIHSYIHSYIHTFIHIFLF